MIHVLDALAGIGIDVRRGLARPFHASESCHVPAWCFVGFGRAKTATIAALPSGVGLVSGAVPRFVGLPFSQPVLFGSAEIPGENACIRADMGVGVKDPEAVACHRSLPSNGALRSIGADRP